MALDRMVLSDDKYHPGHVNNYEISLLERKKENISVNPMKRIGSDFQKSSQKAAPMYSFPGSPKMQTSLLTEDKSAGQMKGNMALNNIHTLHPLRAFPSMMELNYDGSEPLSRGVP